VLVIGSSHVLLRSDTYVLGYCRLYDRLVDNWLLVEPFSFNSYPSQLCSRFVLVKLQMVVQWIKDLKASYDLSRAETQNCAREVADRKKCERIHGGASNGEECVFEELAEKKCLASCLCQEEYVLFYGSHKGKSCASIVEQFKQDLGIAKMGQVETTSRRKPRIPRRCREASYALGNCLHKYTKAGRQ